MEEERLHVAALPHFDMGHLNPMLELCHQLVPHGFTVSLLLPSNHCSKVRPSDLDAQIALVPAPAVGESMISSFPEFQEGVKQLLRDLQPPIKLLVSDFILPWAHDMAQSLRISRVVLYATSAASDNLVYQNLELIFKGYNFDDSNELIDLPGLKALPKNQLKYRSPGHPLLKLMLERAREAVCVLVNSVEEMDGESINALRSECYRCYLPVGPLLSMVSGRNHHSRKEEDDILRWLDEQSPRSVLYIAFGTKATLTAGVVETIARAVISRPVLWAIRRGLVSDNNEPGSVLERLRDGGSSGASKSKHLVVEWAPQTRVLGHSAIGAFLTHCGWNSTMEAVCSGVPMICWPCLYDQGLNAHRAVSEWKVGVMVPEPRSEVGHQELEGLIGTVMDGEEGEEMRKRAQALAKVARGSMCRERSLRAFKDLVHKFAS